MSEYRIHWTAYHVQRAKQSASTNLYYRKLTLKERGAILNYLNSRVYCYPEGNPPKMDRTAFSMRLNSDT